MKLGAIVAMVVAVSVSTSGCLAVAASAIIATDIAATHDKEHWRERFALNNQTRVDAGLEPLNFCDTAYEYDPDWTLELLECTHLLNEPQGAVK